MHKLRILKQKDVIRLQNILFVYGCLEEERMKSFNTTFKRIRLINFTIQDAYQLKRRDFKAEKYDRFAILKKCLSDWNLLHNALKSNFEKIKRSEIKTLVTNHFLNKYTK